MSTWPPLPTDPNDTDSADKGAVVTSVADEVSSALQRDDSAVAPLPLTAPPETDLCEANLADIGLVTPFSTNEASAPTKTDID